MVPEAECVGIQQVSFEVGSIPNFLVEVSGKTIALHVVFQVDLILAAATPSETQSAADISIRESEDARIHCHLANKQRHLRTGIGCEIFGIRVDEQDLETAKFAVPDASSNGKCQLGVFEAIVTCFLGAMAASPRSFYALVPLE